MRSNISRNFGKPLAGRGEARTRAQTSSCTLIAITEPADHFTAQAELWARVTVYSGEWEKTGCIGVPNEEEDKGR